MQPIKLITIAYFIIMHGLTTVYAIFVLQASPLITFLISSLSSLILILISSILYIDNVLLGKYVKGKYYLVFYILFIIPITLFYYLPVFFSKEIIRIIGYVFPSIAQYLLWLSYNPFYILFIFPQVIISIFLTIFMYFYLKKLKK